MFPDGQLQPHRTSKHSQNSSHKRRQSLQEPHSEHKLHSDPEKSRMTTGRGGGFSGRPSWSPDRRTIDAQLNEMKKRVSVGVSAALD